MTKRKINLDEAHPLLMREDVRLVDPNTGRQIWPVWHRECAEVCFFTLRPNWMPGNRLDASNVILFSGEHPEPHSEMICGSCRERIKKHDVVSNPPPRKRLIISPGVIH